MRLDIDVHRNVENSVVTIKAGSTTIEVGEYDADDSLEIAQELLIAAMQLANIARNEALTDEIDDLIDKFYSD